MPKGNSSTRTDDNSQYEYIVSDINFDPFVGAILNGKEVFPLYGDESVVNQIWSGTVITSKNGVITYTFADTPHLVGQYNVDKTGYAGNSYNSNFFIGSDAQNGYRPFTPEQEEAARAAIQLWDDLIPQDFVEKNGMGADIVFANSADPGQAYAYLPYFNGTGVKWQSDVFTADPNLRPDNGFFEYGEYGNTVLIHEIGHAIGLTHPGAYNGAGATNYAGQAEYFQDSTQYTIMSYWNPANTGANIIDWHNSGGLLYGNLQGPGLHDILAIQAAYGADPNTRTGDTVYGFGSNAGNSLFDFVENSLPHYAIYDAGGEDTIDASGFTISQIINLTPGSFSSIGQVTESLATMSDNLIETYLLFTGVQLGGSYEGLIASWISGAMADNADANEFYYGVENLATINTDNFAIAYNTVIENAVGGQGRDLIIGNDVDNILDGQAGDDVIWAGAGDDVVIGGLGADEMSGDDGADTFQFSDLELGDVITDFDGSEGDMIDLSAFAGELGSDLTFVEGGAFTGAAGEVIYDGSMVSVDMDGDSMADFSVTIANGADIDASMLALAAGA